MIYLGHALKLVQTSFPKSFSRESAKHGMGITTEHFISEQIARHNGVWDHTVFLLKCGHKKQAATSMNNTGVFPVKMRLTIRPPALDI